MTAEETLYTGTVTNIATLIEACNLPPEAFVLVERVPRVVIDDAQERCDLLRFARLSDGVAIESYTSGRVFNLDFELRWEQDAVTVGKTNVVYIGIKRNLPGLTKSKRKLQTEDRERHYYLFGERLGQDMLSKMGIEPEEGYYAETRVPRLLRYPTLGQGQQPQRLQITARKYRFTELEKSREEGRTYRFVNLIPAEEVEE